MKEEWEFYFCCMEDKAASIAFNHGLRGSLNKSPIRYAVSLKVSYEEREDGMPAPVAWDTLNPIEDEVDAFVERACGIKAGRVTTDGVRTFHYYSDSPEEEWNALIEELQGRFRSNIAIRRMEDPQREVYWRELFPSERDWQVIRDMKVLNVLQENGDIPKIARRIDHWAYFKDLLDASEYESWLAHQGYTLLDDPGENDKKIRVRFFHTGTMVLNEITHHTISLMEKAKACNGEYDGWETSVERGPVA